MFKDLCGSRPIWQKIALMLGVLTLISAQVFFRSPDTTERLYYQVVFRWLRSAYDATLAILPFPMFYVFVLGVILLVIYIYSYVIRTLRGDNSILGKLCNIFFYLLSLLSLILFLFYFLWGFNYGRQSFDKRFQLPEIAVDSTMVKAEALEVTRMLNEARRKLKDRIITYDDLPEHMEDEIRELLESFMSTHGEHVYGEGRVRILKPEGVFLRFSTAGMYMPFAMEGQIDAGLHPIQYPFVMAHEMGHVYGYSEESVCNLIGYLTCIESADPVIRYSGLMGYWRYLLSNVRRISPSAYKELWDATDERVKQDLEEIYTQMEKFPDVMPKLRDKIYDRYLKANQIPGGLQNYSHVIQLNIRWKAKYSKSN